MFGYLERYAFHIYTYIDIVIRWVYMFLRKKLIDSTSRSLLLQCLS